MENLEHVGKGTNKSCAIRLSKNNVKVLENIYAEYLTGLTYSIEDTVRYCGISVTEAAPEILEFKNKLIVEINNIENGNPCPVDNMFGKSVVSLFKVRLENELGTLLDNYDQQYEPFKDILESSLQNVEEILEYFKREGE